MQGTDTKGTIKEVVYSLIARKPFRQITVVEISRLAQVNRKTFYNYFPSIYDALLDIERDFLDEISGQIGELEPDDLAGAIYVYYSFLDTEDPVRQKLLYDRDYSWFFERLERDVMTLPFFMRFCPDDEDQDLVLGYLGAALGIYLRWRGEEEQSITLKSLAEKAATLISSGLGAL